MTKTTSKTLIGLVSFLFVFVLIDRSFGALLKPYYEAVVSGALHDFDKSGAGSQDADLLFTGDSHTLHGLDPVLMDELCGCRVGNLSVTGSNMVTTYYALRQYLTANQPPRLLVLQARWANIIEQPDGLQNVLLLDRLTLADQLAYFSHGLDLNFLAKKLSLTFRYRQALPRFWRQDKNVAPATDPGRSEGSTESSRSASVISQFPSREPAVDRVQLYYLDKILSEMKAERIPVVLVQPPEPSDFFGSIKNLSVLDGYIVAAADKFGVAFYDFDDPNEPLVRDVAYYSDEQHLNDRGAALYTARLWDDLKKTSFDAVSSSTIQSGR